MRSADFREPDPGPGAPDRRIERALRRRYQPPADLERRFELPREPIARRHARRPWTPIAAAALLLIALAAAWLGRARPVLEDASLAPRVAELHAPRFLATVGPLEDPRQAPEARRTNLAHLYRAMDAAQRSVSIAACGADDQLAERLSSAYGQAIGLKPGAEGILHGPFASSEWPTGTILTGVAEGETSVLVAEYDDALACCLSMDLPEDSPLRVFTWNVGSVVLTEITPLKNPRLIDYFTGVP
jgi:hypothetical protein